MANTPEDQRIAELKKLQKSKGRDVIVDDLLRKLEVLESNILDNVQEGYNVVKYNQWDIEKVKRAFLVMLKEYPETLIKNFTPIEDPEELLESELLEKAQFVDIE